MKNVLIVSPSFPPSNLTAGHRSRIFSNHLNKFGWNPIILTVDPKYYEEELDIELKKLLPENLEIILTRALPVKPIRIIGDIGIRAFFWHLYSILKISKQKKIDMLYIPIPSNFSALLGIIVNKLTKIPYSIDYIDPWVHEWPEAKRRFTRAWVVYHLNKILEPIALSNVSLITSVAPGYYKGVIERYDWIDESICKSMPYGSELLDFKYIEKDNKPASLFKDSDKEFRFIYAGAMLPKAYKTLDALFLALKKIKATDNKLSKLIKFYFIGTGYNPNKDDSFNVSKFAENYGISENIIEYPKRIPYLEILRHLKSSDSVLIVGSSESHYTPSKVFQGIMSKKPLFALLHSESSAVSIIKESQSGYLITFNKDNPVNNKVEEIVTMIKEIVTKKWDPENVNWDKFNLYSAESVTKQLAESFDEALRPEK